MVGVGVMGMAVGGGVGIGIDPGTAGAFRLAAVRNGSKVAVPT